MRRPGKTIGQVQSTAHLGEPGTSDRNRHGIAREELLALPLAWDKYWLPPASPFTEYEVLPPSLRSFAKMGNYMVLSLGKGNTFL